MLSHVIVTTAPGGGAPRLPVSQLRETKWFARGPTAPGGDRRPRADPLPAREGRQEAGSRCGCWISEPHPHGRFGDGAGSVFVCRVHLQDAPGHLGGA